MIDDRKPSPVKGKTFPERAAAPKLQTIESVFQPAKMRAAWKNTVRNGMRAQNIEDLHDYLDVHRNIQPICERVSADVVRGVYRPQEPEVISSEKRMGVVRRLLVPSAVDAIVLQTVVNAVEPEIRAAQPHKNAYYSRSHDAPPDVEDFSGTFGYPWWKLWPKFQMEIWRFSKACPITVTTDIANYFDSIPLAKLRNSITIRARADDSLLDFLFFLLEAFIWRPRYMPVSGVGLPTIEFDTPRLLAHAYLFPIDQFLVEKVGDNYVRWMDDIDFGCDSERDAKLITGELDKLLASLGLRLNLSKTNVMSGETANNYFWVSENTKLNVFTNSVQQESPRIPKLDELIRTSTRSAFDDFLAKPPTGHWEKIFKRYLTVFAKLKDPFAEAAAIRRLSDHPALREPCFRYLRALGPTKERIEAVTEFAREACVDDVAFFAVCQLLVEWEVPSRSTLTKKILEFAETMTMTSEPIRIGSILRLYAKYGSTGQLAGFIKTTVDRWRISAWAARQVAACQGMLKPRFRKLVKETVIAGGLLDALQVISHIEELEKLSAFDKQLTSYLSYLPKPGYPYALSKFVLAFTLGRAKDTDKSLVLGTLPQALSDPTYRGRLEALVVAGTGRRTRPPLT